MSSISFNNPWLLLILIPLVAVLLIPFFISVKKENKNFHNITSAVIHIVMAVVAILALAGIKVEKDVMENDVIILADVSYSSHNSYDLMDTYIKDISNKCDKNTNLSVVTFANECEVLTDFGEKLKSVKESSVDKSSTNISEALKFSKELFNENTNKKIVILSDGMDTSCSDFASVLTSLAAEDIIVDAIYLDNNIKENAYELQINQIEYNRSTYQDSEEYVSVVVQSNVEGVACMLDMTNTTTNQVTHSELELYMDKGLNVFKFPLDTSTEGLFNYEITINSDYLSYDTSLDNNSAKFTQRVSNELNMLFVTDSTLDKTRFVSLYSPYATIETYVKSKSLPYRVEDLIKYDYIVLSNVDISGVINADLFVRNLDTVVAKYGKTLLTFGDVKAQIEDNDILQNLSNMLPVSYGNDSNGEDRLVALILDFSRSMSFNGHMIRLKSAAKAIVDLLEDKTTVVIIGFAGETEYIMDPLELTYENRIRINGAIDNLDCKQGTFMGTALNEAYNLMLPMPQTNKSAYLISDGLPYGTDTTNAVTQANKYRAAGIKLSCLNTGSTKGQETLEKIAIRGNGFAEYIESSSQVEEFVTKTLSTQITETYITNGDYKVNIEKTNDEFVENVNTVENISGFIYSRKKANASLILSTDYQRTIGQDPDTEEDVIVTDKMPLLARWSYGAGTVASLTTDIMNYDWTYNWKSTSSNGTAIINNMCSNSKPITKNDNSLMVTIEKTGSKSNINVFVPTKTVTSELKATITDPDGNVEEKLLVFDSENFITTIDTAHCGKYQIDFEYKVGIDTYTNSVDYYVDITDEYDSFVFYDESNLNYMVSEDGKVYNDSNVDLKSGITPDKYEYSFIPALMIIVVVLFVIDIIIRKLTIQDIKTLFSRGGKKK